MRIWKKYHVSDSWAGKGVQSKDISFHDHSRAMGGYNADNSYEKKETYFQRHLSKRHAIYDEYLRGHIDKDEEILSVASGRCVTELRLMNDGYSVSCSDFGFPQCLAASFSLFGLFPFSELDILRGPPPKEYDVIINLSTAYLFNPDELEQYFSNISEGLRNGGRLFMDPGGPRDNLFSIFWHNLYLPTEYRLYSLYSRLFRNQKLGCVSQLFGYRYKDSEIRSVASRAGLIFVGLDDFDHLSELRRSFILKPVINSNFIEKGPLNRLLRRNPYIRMFQFQKVSPSESGTVN